jgi:hypothetical protein
LGWHIDADFIRQPRGSFAFIQLTGAAMIGHAVYALGVIALMILSVAVLIAMSPYLVALALLALVWLVHCLLVGVIIGPLWLLVKFLPSRARR